MTVSSWSRWRYVETIVRAVPPSSRFTEWVPGGIPRVLSVDHDNEFRSRYEWIWVRRFGSTTYVSPQHTHSWWHTWNLVHTHQKHEKPPSTSLFLVPHDVLSLYLEQYFRTLSTCRTDSWSKQESLYTTLPNQKTLGVVRWPPGGSGDFHVWLPNIGNHPTLRGVNVC